VSSTAVTLTFAKRSVDESHQQRQGEALYKSLAAGLLLAWAIMFVRVVFAVSIVHRPLVIDLVVPLVAMGSLVAAAALWYWYRSRQSESSDEDEVPLKNPFRLLPAMKFAAYFTLVELVVKLVKTYISEQGFYVVAALAGLTDVDAITLAMSQYAAEGGQARLAVTAIAIAIISNTLVKCGLVFFLGSRELGWRLVSVTVAVVAAGTLSVWWIWRGGLP
jgi:uncharacterized membrane protein (DUF4010 family)